MRPILWLLQTPWSFLLSRLPAEEEEALVNDCEHSQIEGTRRQEEDRGESQRATADEEDEEEESERCDRDSRVVQNNFVRAEAVVRNLEPLSEREHLGR